MRRCYSIVDSNKKMGNSFERELCDILASHGFWCHNLAQNQSGQPADVIAVRNMKPYLIDCKVCKNDRFPLSRIEENQKNAMKLWRKCGNGNGWFAMKISTGIYMVSFLQLEAHKFKSLSKWDIATVGVPLERWCEC
jgi:Holliday junction resolvase